MLAAEIVSEKNIEIKNVKTPTPKKNELLIEIKACGVCGTDHHIYQGKYKKNYPLIMGHEMSGKVSSLGSEVIDFKIGDKVAVNPNIFCNKCVYCHKGKVNFCDNLEAIGVTRNGGFSEYLTVPVRNAYKLSDDVSYHVGALAEPISCILHGLDKIDIREDDEVLIFGAGIIGILLGLIIRDHHCKKVIFSEINSYRINKVKSFNFPVLNCNIDSSKFDVIIDATGNGNALQESINRTKVGSQVLFFGVARKDLKIKISPYQIYEKEIIITGSYLNPFTTDRAVKIINETKLNLSKLVDKKLKLKDLGEFFVEPGENYLKAMFVN